MGKGERWQEKNLYGGGKGSCSLIGGVNGGYYEAYKEMDDMLMVWEKMPFYGVNGMRSFTENRWEEEEVLRGKLEERRIRYREMVGGADADE